jgi:hypothetical protein
MLRMISRETYSGATKNFLKYHVPWVGATSGGLRVGHGMHQHPMHPARN